MVAYVVYLYGTSCVEGEIMRLQEQRALLEQRRALLVEEREALQLRRASQGDPAWVELLLMQELGLIPKGSRKVCYG